jgi:hypothetical protein
MVFIDAKKGLHLLTMVLWLIIMLSEMLQSCIIIHKQNTLIYKNNTCIVFVIQLLSIAHVKLIYSRLLL